MGLFWFFKHRTQLENKSVVLNAMELVKIDFLWSFCTVQSDSSDLTKGKFWSQSFMQQKQFLIFIFFSSHWGFLVFKSNSALLHLLSLKQCFNLNLSLSSLEHNWIFESAITADLAITAKLAKLDQWFLRVIGKREQVVSWRSKRWTSKKKKKKPPQQKKPTTTKKKHPTKKPT